VKTILFVCTANICRSPMAAGLMRKRIADTGLAEQISVESAGIWASEGRGASENTVAVLKERGVSLAEHQSQPVSMALLRRADIILVMEEAHRRSLFYLAPEFLDKVYLLTEMVGQYEDVDDPYGGKIEEYVKTVNLMERLIEAGLPQILARLGITSHITSRVPDTNAA
jgi:protein-tyrosine phosphatase